MCKVLLQCSAITPISYELVKDDLQLYMHLNVKRNNPLLHKKM